MATAERSDWRPGGGGRREPALLVFFTKATSGPARRMDSLMAQLEAREKRRLRVMRVDVDERPELAARLGVSEVPALVLVKGRRAVARLVGRSTGSRIDRMLDAHLAP